MSNTEFFSKFPDSIRVHVAEIARRLKEGRAAIMVGSGFSKNALTTGSVQFPSWQELGDFLFERLHERKPDDTDRYLNPLKLASEFESAFGRAALDNAIRKWIPDEQCDFSQLHIKLLELPWVDVFTTNYDTLLERATLKANARKYDVVVSREDLPFAQKPRIVKLHGSFPSQRPFVITEEDYRKYPSESACFVNTVQQSLIENVLCLIGFSGDDPNFLNWTGWIRDNLGHAYSPKIYMIGLFQNTSVSQKALLTKRNIELIDLSLLKTDITYSEALKDFFSYLDRENESSPMRWGEDYLKFAKNETIPQFILRCKTNRESYSGWIIAPLKQRNHIWHLCERTWKNWHENLLTPSEHQFDLVYEFCWLIERSLCTIGVFDLTQTVENFVQDSKFRDKKRNKWFDLTLWLLREYRLSGKWEQWNSIENITHDVCSRLNDAQKSQLHYERALQALFAFDIPLLKKRLQEWDSTKMEPFLEAKKASLYAELGDFEKAKTILEEALITIRRQINANNEDSYLFLAQEGCIMAISSRAEMATLYSIRDDNPDKVRSDIEQKRKARRGQLRQYKCDIDESILQFSLSLQSSPEPFIQGKVTKPEFDIGYERVSHLFNAINHDLLLGYAYLIFAEVSAIPYRLGMINYEDKAAIGAVKRIVEPDTLAWCLTTVARLGNNEMVDYVLSRKLLATLSPEIVDKWCEILIDATKKAEEAIRSVSDYYSSNLAVNYAKTIPEMLSRFATRCSCDAQRKIIDFLEYLYNLENKAHFAKVEDLTRRIIASWDQNHLDELFKRLLAFPVIQTGKPHIDDQFINPILLLPSPRGLVTDDVLNAIINDFLRKSQSKDKYERFCSLVLLKNLFDEKCLSQEQIEEFEKSLWCDIDPKQGFPLGYVNFRLFPSAYLRVHHPEGVDVEKLFRKKVLNPDESIMSNGSHLLDDWLNAFGIFSAHPLFLSDQERDYILQRIVTEWNEKTKILKRECSDFEHSLLEMSCDDFSNRANRLHEVLSKIIIPMMKESTPHETKKKVVTLLSDMEQNGVTCLSSRIAMLTIYPDRKSEIMELVNRYCADSDPDKAESAQFGLCILLAIKKSQKLNLDIPLDSVSGTVRNRLLPALKYALISFRYFLEKCSDCVIEQNLSDVLFGLDALRIETSVSNEQSHIPDAQRLEYRKLAVMLARSLSGYYENKNMEIPSVVLEWRKIAESSGEFWEIRNCWARPKSTD